MLGIFRFLEKLEEGSGGWGVRRKMFKWAGRRRGRKGRKGRRRGEG